MAGSGTARGGGARADVHQHMAPRAKNSSTRMPSQRLRERVQALIRMGIAALKVSARAKGCAAIAAAATPAAKGKESSTIPVLFSISLSAAI